MLDGDEEKPAGNTAAVLVSPIGILHSCFGEKFGIPRQPGLVESAEATLRLSPPYDTPEALRGLDTFSHVWILFLFHRSLQDGWKATVRPPRLGGNNRVGVFASRSNFRPNPVGLSVVRLLGIEGPTLRLGGGDFLDGTPVLDIKPYIPYADCIPAAVGGYAAAPPPRRHEVRFSAEADAALDLLENEERPALRRLVVDMLSYNPRPAYQEASDERLFGTRLFDLELRWKQTETVAFVVSIEPC